MDLTKEEIQREEFKKILYDLAKNAEMLQDVNVQLAMHRRLEALYYSSKETDRFRHFYSDIFSVLTKVQQDPKLGNIVFLVENLQILRKEYRAKRKDHYGKIVDISDNLRKLYDHVNLDVARMSYSDDGDRKISGEASIIKIQTQIKKIDSDVKETADNQSQIVKELNEQKREYIAILGIFAAVVLAFTAGIAFSTSVLENIHSASIYRLTFISLIIGLVLINILFGLFYYIGKLVNGESENKLTPLVISNIVIIVLMIFVICAWCDGCVESRNDRIDKQKMTTTQQINQDAQNTPPGSDPAGL